MSKEKKEEEKGTVHLKLKQRHPKNAMPFKGIIVDGYQYKPYEITESMVNDLMNDKGVKHWISCKELDEEAAEETEEVETELSDEDKAALEQAEEIKANSENQNVDPAPVVDAPAESQEEAATELIDESQVIEDKPKSRKNK